MKENKYKIWTGSIMIQPKSLLILHQETVSGLTIGQWKKNRIYLEYTGLKDKNGTECYEGDIVKMRSEGHYPDYEDGSEGIEIDRTYIGEIVIIASKGVCLKKPKYHDHIDGETKQIQYYLNITQYRSEIIGNIYENPELLNCS